MREIVARSNLAPILNRDRGIITEELQSLVQSTLDSYDAGVNIVRVNFDRADPPQEVIDAFREVQAAEQQRDRLQSEADAYANRALASARGEAAQVLEEAEGYRARVVNEAQGEASRFSAVLAEYALAPDVTRKRLYLETMEQVFGDVDKIIIDDNVGGGGRRTGRDPVPATERVARWPRQPGRVELMARAVYLIPVVVVLILLAITSIFVVDERQKALVLQFGRVIDVKEDPGLAFKLPLIQNVVFYDDRILSRDVDPLEVTPSDDRRLVVDAFARYRIIDVIQFRNAVGAGGHHLGRAAAGRHPCATRCALSWVRSPLTRSSRRTGSR